MNRFQTAAAGHDPGLMRRARRRLLLSLPGRREVFVGAPLWGAAMALSALVALYLRDGTETFQLRSILLLFFCGGAFAWPFALFFGQFCAAGRGRETRFAAFFLGLTACTIAATAFFFAMDYRVFYTRWHAPFGTRIWVYQFVFTFAGAVYQFIVIGIRLYLPLGFVSLVAASLWCACHIGRPSYKMPDQRR